MEKNNIQTTIIQNLIQNERAWLFVIAALFTSSYASDDGYWEIIAGLLSLWSMILVRLNK